MYTVYLTKPGLKFLYNGHFKELVKRQYLDQKTPQNGVLYFFERARPV